MTIHKLSPEEDRVPHIISLDPPTHTKAEKENLQQQAEKPENSIKLKKKISHSKLEKQRTLST